MILIFIEHASDTRYRPPFRNRLTSFIHDFGSFKLWQPRNTSDKNCEHPQTYQINWIRTCENNAASSANHLYLISLQYNLHNSPGSWGSRQARLPDLSPVTIVDTHLVCILYVSCILYQGIWSTSGVSMFRGTSCLDVVGANLVAHLVACLQWGQWLLVRCLVAFHALLWLRD